MKSLRLPGVRDAYLHEKPTLSPQLEEALLRVNWPDGDLTCSLFRGGGGSGDG